MSDEGVNQFLGKMIIAPSFEQKVFGGKRKEAIEEMRRSGQDITPEEEHMLLGIKAEGRQGFAAAIEQWYIQKGKEGASSGTETE